MMETYCQTSFRPLDGPGTGGRMEAGPGLSRCAYYCPASPSHMTSGVSRWMGISPETDCSAASRSSMS